MSVQYTKKYIEAFSSRDIEAVASLLADDFVLEDPVVKRVEGKEKALESIKAIFDSCQELTFTAKNIFKDENTSFIEFIITIDGVKLEGVDILVWENKKIVELRAYLDIPK